MDSHFCQAGQSGINLLSVFDGGVNNGANPGKAVSPLAVFIAELTRYFGLDFDVSYGSFRTVVIRRNLRVIEESQDAVPVFY
jgi:hypothetical protein